MNMNNQDQLKLISGIFSTEDATDILLHLIDKKINYHSCRIFSMSEKFGIDDEHSRRRIAELKSTRAQIQQILETSRLTGKHLKIEADIRIQLTTEATSRQEQKALMEMN